MPDQINNQSNPNTETPVVDVTQLQQEIATLRQKQVEIEREQQLNKFGAIDKFKPLIADLLQKQDLPTIQKNYPEMFKSTPYAGVNTDALTNGLNKIGAHAQTQPDPRDNLANYTPETYHLYLKHKKEQQMAKGTYNGVQIRKK